MQTYVLGFLHNDREVALIKKNRPEWQAGKFNGIGGKVEKLEHPFEAIVREFKEETGVFVPRSMWQHFLTLKGTNATVVCFAANDNGNFLSKVQTMEDEPVSVQPFHLIDTYLPVVPNLKWIVPLMKLRGEYKPVVIEFYGEE